MGEIRNRNSVRVNEEGKKKLLDAKAEISKSEGERLTYLKLAFRAAVAEKTVKRFFSGREDVDWESASAIAKALDLELTDLIDVKPTTPPPETTATFIDWREVCSKMLSPQRRITSNPLMQDESAKKETKQIYVPLALVQKKKIDKRNKEDYSPNEGTRLYEPEYETQQRFEHEAFLSQILECGEGKTKGKQIAVIGEPGAGKTTLLQAIAFWVLEKDLGLPIWVSLADLGRNGTLTDIQTYICNIWLEQAIPPTQLTQEIRDDFINQIQQGRVWLLLDGVDEISGGEASQQPLEEISRQLTGWVGRSSRVVLTCRLNVWQADYNALETFETYRLLDFDYPQQVHQFIDNWFVEDTKKGERLKTELGSTERGRLRDLVQTPLRLMLLCAIWQDEEGNLPDTKAGLYQQCLEQFYKWKQNRFRTSIKEQGDLNQALGRLALRDINEGNSRFRLRESFVIQELGYPDDETSLFYKALQLGWLNNVGIAAESASKEKVYAFYHPTFEEYFAALAVPNWQDFLNHVSENPEQGTYRIFEPQWKEVILLWLGREDIKKQHKEEFIKALVEFEDGCKSLSQIPDWKGFYEYQAYFLAAAGIAEFKDCGLADVIVKQIVKWGFGYFNIEKQEWQSFNERIKQKAQAVIAETDRKKVIAALVELIQNSQDEQTCRDALHNLEAIAKDNSTVITALVELIRTSQDRPTCLLVAHSLGKIAKDNPTSITALEKVVQNSQDEYLCYRMAYILGEIAQDNLTAIIALEGLIANSQDEEIRWRAAHTLGEIAQDNLTAIIALGGLIANSQDEEIRWKATHTLGKIAKNHPTAITVLLKLIQDSQDEVTCIIAARGLGEIAKDNPTVITALEELIWDCQYEYTCIIAADSLGKIAKNNSTAITVLLELIQDSQDENICRDAADILGEIAKNNSTAITALEELISEEQDKKICMLAADILGEIAKNHPTAITALEELIRNSQDEETCIVAARNLGEIAKDNPIAITTLEKLIQNSQDETIRREAAVSLGEIAKDNSTVITALVELIRNSQDELNCMLAARSLGEIGKNHPTAITALVELIRNSQDKLTRWQAADSLGKIAKNHPTAITALVELIRNSQDELTSWQAVSSLEKTLTESENMAAVITALRNYLSNEVYKFIWHCAQTMTYPAFYQAWHQKQ